MGNVVPNAHIKTASISLNSQYPFPLQVTKGTVVLPCSLSQQLGLGFAPEHAKSGSTTTQIKAHLLDWDLDPSLNTSTCYQSVTQKINKTSIHSVSFPTETEMFGKKTSIPIAARTALVNINLCLANSLKKTSN